jgi:hypothetical protein
VQHSADFQQPVTSGGIGIDMFGEGPGTSN